MFGWITGSYRSSAKLSGSNLIMSLPDAKTPTIWTMDTSQIGSAVIRIEADKDNHLQLVLDKGGKSKEVLAVYEKKGPAIQALIKASKAMQAYKQGQDNPSKRSFLRILGWIFGALLVIWLVGVIWTVLTWDDPDVPVPAAEPAQHSGIVPSLPPAVDPNSLGVPIPLEQFLTRQK